jgi:transglutaminase superfamily protein
VVDFQLRALGVQRTARMVPLPSTTQASPRQLQRAETYAYWLRRAARHHVVRAQCLHQSLALHAWLREEGLPSTIEIGVRRVGQELRGHAWVHVGKVLVGDSKADVAPFVTLGARGGGAWL